MSLQFFVLEVIHVQKFGFPLEAVDAFVQGLWSVVLSDHDICSELLCEFGFEVVVKIFKVLGFQYMNALEQ